MRILRKVIAILTSDGKMICSVRKSDFSVRKNSIFPYGKIFIPYGNPHRRESRRHHHRLLPKKHVSVCFRTKHILPASRNYICRTENIIVSVRKLIFSIRKHTEQLHFLYGKYYCLHRSIQKHSFSVSVMVPTIASAIRISIRKKLYSPYGKMYFPYGNNSFFRTEKNTFLRTEKTHFPYGKITLA